jgi:hypothetical protein
MNSAKYTMIAGFVILSTVIFGQEPEKMQIQPMKKEVQKVSTTENVQGNTQVKGAPVKKAQAKAVEPKERVVEPKKD